MGTDTRTDEEIIKGVLEECAEIRRRKNADYGASYAHEGAAGVFIRTKDKVMRLRSLLWLNKPDTVGEALRDTAIDLVNYALYLVVCLTRGNLRGE